MKTDDLSYTVAAMFSRLMYVELPVKVPMRTSGEEGRLAAHRVNKIRNLFFSLSESADDLLEIGAHHAEASVRFVRERKGRRAFAFEAINSVYKDAIDMNMEENVHYFNYAVGNKNGKENFYIPNDDHLKVWASTKVRTQNRAQTTSVEVDMITLNKASKLAGAGKTAIWMDVEGAADDVLSGGEDFLRRNVISVYTELESDRSFENSASSISVIARLIRCGFVPVARDNQFPNAFNALFVKQDVYDKNHALIEKQIK